MTASLCDPQLPDRTSELGQFLLIDLNSGEVNRKVLLPLVPAVDTVHVSFGSKILIGGNSRFGWIYEHTEPSILIGPDFDFNSQPVGTKLLIEYVPKDWQ